MARYKNFNIAIYFTTRCIASINSLEEFERDFGFFEKHLKCSKVYLETHRDDMDTPKEKLEQLRDLFTVKGMDVSGAITTTLMKSTKNKPLIDETGVFGCGGSILEKSGKVEPPVEKGYQRIWNTFCYTDEASRRKLQEVAEYTASIFDEFIIDDFYFTNCTCPSCIEAKGDRSWEEFRLQLMTEVSRELVVGPAKAINPKVKAIIKYPNWNESYPETGYNPETQKDIFDLVYTGTETRDTNHTFQHLPRYGSYSLLRWFENLKPGYNGGGWIDQWNSIQNLGYYLEQAFLTFFAKGRELTLFCYSWLVDTVYIPPLGHELEHLDQIIGEIGKPLGIPVYQPIHSSGEEHLIDYLGMAGLAFEPTPQFPETDRLIMLTAESVKDPEIMGKLKAHLMKGGDACLTSGFIRETQGKGVEEFTSVIYTDKKVITKDYTILGPGWGFTGDYCGRDTVIFPGLKYKNNAAESLILANKEDNNFPVFLRNEYGKGTIYVLAVSDDFAEIYLYPMEVLTFIRQYLMSGMGIYLEGGAKVGLFLYDNDTFILESFQDQACKVKLHLVGGNRKLIEVKNGKELPASIRKEKETIFEIELWPVFYRMFRITG